MVYHRVNEVYLLRLVRLYAKWNICNETLVVLVIIEVQTSDLCIIFGGRAVRVVVSCVKTSVRLSRLWSIDVANIAVVAVF